MIVVIVLAAGITVATATTYQVGPVRAYHSITNLPALAPGDIVEIDPGTYNEVKRWTNPGSAANPIIIRGVGATRPVFDATGKDVGGSLPNPRAAFQIEADYITIENLEFKNARNGNNGAGIRVRGGNNATIRNCRITDCDMGMMSDGNSNLLVETSEICSNGTALYDGYSHNFYLGGTSATLRFCYIHDSLYGQNFKTRAHYTELLYNYIADSQDGEIGMVDAAETAAANSHAVMIGNIVISKPRLSGYNNGRFIQFGHDSGGQHNGTLFAFHNTFIAGDGRISFLSANTTGATVVAHNNIFYGSDKIVGTTGGGISGSNNWAPATATIPVSFTATTTGTDARFTNRVARDFHLTAASACRNKGMSTLPYLDGTGAAHPGVPAFEYMNHALGSPRPSDGKLDLGAYEFNALPVIKGAGLDGSNFIVSFSTVAPDQYDVQRSEDLTSGLWSPVATNIVGTGDDVQVTDTNAAFQPQRFYRVKLLP